MQTASKRYAFDPQDLDEIMDSVAKKRASVMGHGRSLITGKEWLQVRDQDGTVRQVPLN